MNIDIGNFKIGDLVKFSLRGYDILGLVVHTPNNGVSIQWCTGADSGKTYYYSFHSFKFLQSLELVG